METDRSSAQRCMMAQPKKTKVFTCIVHSEQSHCSLVQPIMQSLALRSTVRLKIIGTCNEMIKTVGKSESCMDSK